MFHIFLGGDYCIYKLQAIFGAMPSNLCFHYLSLYQSFPILFYNSFLKNRMKLSISKPCSFFYLIIEFITFSISYYENELQ